jgi:hypothetical protein
MNQKDIDKLKALLLTDNLMWESADDGLFEIASIDDDSLYFTDDTRKELRGCVRGEFFTIARADFGN